MKMEEKKAKKEKKEKDIKKKDNKKCNCEECTCENCNCEEKIEELENKYGVIAIEGGRIRNQSIGNSLNYISKHYECDKIILVVFNFFYTFVSTCCRVNLEFVSF